VLPEALDELAADDPRGLRSRRDLRRVHRAMRSVSILRRAVSRLRLAAPPARILELGAGDGSLLLRFARTLEPRWTDVELTLLDRRLLVSDRTRAQFAQLGWRPTLLGAEALAWAAGRQERRYDLCIANLFLHHFESPELSALLRGVAASSSAFVACEPRRGALARIGSRLVALLGANQITRGDAVKSVAAGFAGRELSEAWDSAAGDWILEEYPALPFTHCFGAVRRTARAAAGVRGI
jgi:methyltransferase family protein